MIPQSMGPRSASLKSASTQETQADDAAPLLLAGCVPNYSNKSAAARGSLLPILIESKARSPLRPRDAPNRVRVPLKHGPPATTQKEVVAVPELTAEAPKLLFPPPAECHLPGCTAPWRCVRFCFTHWRMIPRAFRIELALAKHRKREVFEYRMAQAVMLIETRRSKRHAP